MKQIIKRSIIQYLFLVMMIAISVSPALAWSIGSWSGVREIQTDLTITRNSLGTSTADGLILQNITAAASGAQQISPRTRWTGQGWKTDATAGSQTVDYIAELVPVQGAANPQARLDFNYQINGAGFQATPTLSFLNGKVGFGTKTPVTDLHINSSVNTAEIRLTTTTGFSDSWDILADNNSGRFTLQGSNFGDLITVTRSGNIGTSGQTTFGTSAARVLGMALGTMPTTSLADMAQLGVADVNAEAGKASFMMRSEITANGNGAVTGAFIKTDTGDFAAGYEGMLAINTFDNTAKIWAEGAWRAIATAW